MQEVNQNPNPGTHDNTTHDPALDEPGMDAMSPLHGNPSSDVDNDDDKDEEDDEEE